jgi:hypothetical protein
MVLLSLAFARVREATMDQEDGFPVKSIGRIVCMRSLTDDANIPGKSGPDGNLHRGGETWEWNAPGLVRWRRLCLVGLCLGVHGSA